MRGKGTAVTVIALLLLTLITYTIYDNNRVIVVHETVTIARLPRSYAGFTILQIADLHSKHFGPGQQHLLDVISSCSYDVIVINGDMRNPGDESMEAFFDLLSGLDNAPVLFVKGNTDPADFCYFTGTVTEFGRKLEQHSVTLLNQPYPMSRGDDTIWFTPFHTHQQLRLMYEAAKKALQQEGHDLYGYRQLQLRFWEEAILFWNNADPDEVKIALTHHPASYKMLETATPETLPDYDLIIAGHYHGGQLRIPFLGAICIPRGPGTWFPRQSTVSGLASYGPYQQYISRGLGASNRVPYFNFRLFNSPEINLITLVPGP